MNKFEQLLNQIYAVEKKSLCFKSRYKWWISPPFTYWCRVNFLLRLLMVTSNKSIVKWVLQGYWWIYYYGEYYSIWGTIQAVRLTLRRKENHVIFKLSLSRINSFLSHALSAYKKSNIITSVWWVDICRDIFIITTDSVRLYSMTFLSYW